MDLSHYALLAELFYFPDENYPRHVETAIEITGRKYPHLLEHMVRFESLLPYKKAGPDNPFDAIIRLGEMYTRSFDVQSVTTLDMGYLLFGDDYKRGQLLVNLNQEHKKHGVSCRGELADHLPNVLILLSRLEDMELATELTWEIVVPSLRLMIAEFDPQQITKKEALYKKHYKTLIQTSADPHTFYKLILIVLEAALSMDFSVPASHGKTITNRSCDFLASVGKELEMGQKTFKPKKETAWTV